MGHLEQIHCVALLCCAGRQPVQERCNIDQRMLHCPLATFTTHVCAPCQHCYTVTVAASRARHAGSGCRKQWHFKRHAGTYGDAGMEGLTCRVCMQLVQLEVLQLVPSRGLNGAG